VPCETVRLPRGYSDIDPKRHMWTRTTNADPKAPSDRDRPWLGRPRADQAGEVDDRILQASEQFFLQQGYARTTLEQIAASARVGNTTLY
jgi:Bacterial regulatory proteins, tetR family